MEMYYINLQKVNCKSMKQIANRVVVFDGMVRIGFFSGGSVGGVKREKGTLVSVEQRMTEIVTEYINSGLYSRITIDHAIEEGGKKTKVFDWRMNTEVVQAQKEKYDEYKSKRDALKAQIEALEAQVKELDRKWYRG